MAHAKRGNPIGALSAPSVSLGLSLGGNSPMLTHGAADGQGSFVSYVADTTLRLDAALLWLDFLFNV